MHTLQKKPFQKPQEKEINLDKLDFSNSVKLDKRTFIQLYTLRIKTFHPVYICFIERNPASIRFIEISDFIFGIITDVTFNAVFYSDEYITNTYHSGYDFVYEISKSCFAFLAGLLVGLVVKLLKFDLPDDDEVYEDYYRTKDLNIRYKIVKKVHMFLFFLL